MNGLSFEELKEQFCKWHCTKKNAKIDEATQEIELTINGCVVYGGGSESVTVELCQYCPINDFLYFLRR